MEELMFTISILPIWQILVVAGTILALAEAIIPGFIILPVGVGLILTGVIAAFTENTVLIWISFFVFEFSSIYLARKFLGRALNRPKILTAAEGMIGQSAVVTEPIEPGQTGYVKLYGDQWMALSYSRELIRVGEKVVISKIDGNKVWVERV